MELGIFSKTFARPSLEGVFDAVVAHGFRSVQFNLECAGLPPLPDLIEPEEADRIRRAAGARDIRIAAVSGTFNMIDPDRQKREKNLGRLGVLAAACERLGTTAITLCTGTRDPDDMWRRHPDNDSPAAWRDLAAAMTAAVNLTEGTDVSLAFEPEPGNVVQTVRQARDLIREVGSPRLGVVLDPANLFERFAPDEETQLPAILDEAVALLGDRVALAHGKDRGADGVVRPAGQGIVPWDRFLASLRDVGYDGPLVLHGLDEREVDAAVTFLRTEAGASLGGG
jgi:sugar phosphate isomerase/epimerase